MHLKRTKTEKFWPVPRKGTKYLAVPTHNKKDSVPLVVVMRDILKLVKTKKELKKVLNEKLVKINNKLIRDTNYPVGLFDILSLQNKNYRAVLDENKKISLKEISDRDLSKLIKIIGKKVLKKGKIQFNLMDGRNILKNDKLGAEVGDSVVFNFSTNKLDKIIKMEKGKTAHVIKGKHLGASGKIDDIIERGGKKLAKITIKNKEKINVWVKNLIIGE